MRSCSARGGSRELHLGEPAGTQMRNIRRPACSLLEAPQVEVSPENEEGKRGTDAGIRSEANEGHLEARAGHLVPIHGRTTN